jgi:hypothetical protein
METMIGHPANSVIDQFEGLTTDLEAEAIRVVRHSRLASSDIEAEALVRLARRGHDWSGTLRRRRRAP